MKRINLKQVNWMKALKIAGGGVAAILLAEALGLQNAASAGIITLLTVQNTRRETVMSSVRRFAGFGIMTLLSLPIYHFCGTAPWSFGIVLLLLLLLCYAFRMNDATPINAVMATHYMFAGGVSIGMGGNEILLLVIGSGIGVCLNWFMPRNLKKIHEMQRQLDEEIRGILERMSVRLLEVDHTGYDDSCFARTERLSEELRREIDLFLQNQTWQDDIYFMRYTAMRREQCRVLQVMYRLEEQFAAYRRDALPETRAAFENRAILYSILTELRSFLEIKQRFYLALPEQERKQMFERLTRDITPPAQLQ